MQSEITIQTNGQGLYEFTNSAKEFVGRVTAEFGLLTVFVRHTSCSLMIQENADPDVQHDLNRFFAKLVPSTNHQSMKWITHTNE